MRPRVTACTEDSLAVMSFPEIGETLGITSANARNSFYRAMNKLRSNEAAMRDMTELARELEKRRPVQFDWFGDEEEQIA